MVAQTLLKIIQDYVFTEFLNWIKYIHHENPYDEHGMQWGNDSLTNHKPGFLTLWFFDSLTNHKPGFLTFFSALELFNHHSTGGINLIVYDYVNLIQKFVQHI